MFSEVLGLGHSLSSYGPEVKLNIMQDCMVQETDISRENEAKDRGINKFYKGIALVTCH